MHLHETGMCCNCPGGASCRVDIEREYQVAMSPESIDTFDVTKEDNDNSAEVVLASKK